MKNSLKNVLGWGIAAALLVTTIQTNAAPSHQSGPPVRIGLHFGYYGGYYRPLFPAYYGWGYPHIGFSMGLLPLGYQPFYFGSTLYYCYDGVYYLPYHNGYQVAVPPVGAEVPVLPRHARPVLIDGMPYYTQNGVYYKPEKRADGSQGYIIAGKDGVLNTHMSVPAPPYGRPAAAPPVNAAPAVPGPAGAMPPVVSDVPKLGDQVMQLPDGCKSVSIAGKTYFVSADQVYYEQTVEGKQVVYKVQGILSSNSKQ